MTHDVMYRALVEKDSSYEGIFFAAIKTTGIFCRPTCSARKPKKENVEFFPTPTEAILHGYRPCKMCSPLDKPGETPRAIQTILDELNDTPALHFRDDTLRKRGIDPAMLRRWFKKHHGITFHSYQRMLRINAAYRKIKDGARVTDAAFDSGYASLSGFTDTYKTTVGVPPSHTRTQAVITMMRIETPLGPMAACVVDEGLCMLEFTDRRMLETQFRILTTRFRAQVLQGTHPVLERASRELAEYFEGRRRAFTIPLVLPGSEFQKRVWSELQQIPYGTTRSYKEQAEALGVPHAVRAVANANGMNRIAIIIP
ncbi:MAG TPA: methylated-DNA--[protein]-cysteine S-methyltransferase, partial [Bacteroidota bacterium]|nr:methylated-DNA--[protein]-cysteine S-methyltransferase [Bacteroidota bacterium]